jgi:hypothetical protein
MYSMKPCNVQVSKLIILHEEGEGGKSNHVTHTVYFLTSNVLYETLLCTLCDSYSVLFNPYCTL